MHALMLVSSACTGDAPYLTVPQRNETIVKGLESTLQTVYLLHELDEAAEKIKARKLSPVDGECSTPCYRCCCFVSVFVT
jgi:hypothetical protein